MRLVKISFYILIFTLLHLPSFAQLPVSRPAPAPQQPVTVPSELLDDLSKHHFKTPSSDSDFIEALRKYHELQRPDDVEVSTPSSVPFAPLDSVPESFGNMPFQVVPGDDVEFELSKLKPSAERKRLYAALNTEPSQTCNTAASEWKSVLGDAGGLNGNIKFSEIIQNAKINNFSLFTKGAVSYDNTCLSTDADLDQKLINAGIRSYIALILHNDMPICGALRVSEKKYLTARHCFFESKSGNQTYRVADVKVSLLEDKFATEASGTGLSINSAPITANLPAFSYPEDYVILQVDKKLSDFAPFETDFTEDFGVTPTDEDVTEVGDLVLLGYFRFHNTTGLESDFLNGETDPNWRDGMRWTRNALCTFADFNTPCKAHFCQTDARFSGSPIFSTSLKNGKIVVRGMHIAAMGEAEGCNFNWLERVGNIAIDPPNHALK